MTYFSQYGQDKFLDIHVFKGMRNGIFLEMGADDGITGSNTLFFERERGWSGICVEPRPDAYTKLIRNRKCQTVRAAVSVASSLTQELLEVKGNMGQLSGLVGTFDHRHLQRIMSETEKDKVPTSIITVPNIRINDLLSGLGGARVNYFSLDTEGGELEILKSIDLVRFPIDCISIENKFEEKDVYRFFTSHGYRLATRIKIDDIFVLKGSPFDTYREPWIKKIRRWERKGKEMVKKIFWQTKS